MRISMRETARRARPWRRRPPETYVHRRRTGLCAIRRSLAVALVILAASLTASVAEAHADSAARAVLRGWYDMALALTRHPATFSPPVASRAYGYIGVTAFEAVASGSRRLRTLAGQLNGLTTAPERDAAVIYD